MKSIFSPHLELTAKVMDLRLERQNIVMGNLSNISTPRYRPRRMEFEQQLQSAMDLDARGKLTRTDPKHMPSTFDPEGFQGRAIQEFKPRVVYGEDRVNLDKEMSIMQKNMLQYKTLSTIMQSSFKGLKKVVAEGAK